MAKVIFKDNLFEGKEESFIFHVGTLREVMQRLAHQNQDFAKDLETVGDIGFIVTVNDLSIDCEVWNLYPLKADDEIVVSYDVGWEAVLLPVLTAIWKTITSTAFLVQLAINIAVYAINYFTRPDPPRMGSIRDMTSSSPTYSWSGIVTTYDVDRPIPPIYGRHRVGGNVINHYVETDGDKNWWHILLSLGHGQNKGIVKADGSGVCENGADIPDILINGNPFANYNSLQSIEWDFRLGTLDQNPIEGFDATYTVYPLAGVKLTQAGYVYTVQADVVNGVEFKLSMPNGLWTMNQILGPEANMVRYRVEYRVHGAPDWIDEGEFEIKEASKNAIYRTYRKNGLNGKYDFRITRTTPEQNDFNSQSDLYLYSVSEIMNRRLSYPGLALLYLKILATEYLQGEMPNFSVMVDGRTVMVPELTYGGNVIEFDQCYWDPETETYKYANWDSDGIHQSDIGEAIVTGGWVAQNTKNPIWNTMDFVSSRRYGNGEHINLETLDLELEDAEAKYCHGLVKKDGVNPPLEHRFEMDGVIDGISNSIDMLSQITSTFNGYPVWSDGTYKILIDRPLVPAAMLTMGNIVKNSFKWAFYPISQRPNWITASFVNPSLNYSRDSREIVDNLVYSNNLPIRKHGINIPMVTRDSQVLRILKYMLNVAKYRTQVIEFSGGMDSIHLHGGDAFYFSHDLNRWMVGGRILDVSGTTLTLDRPVTIEVAKSYVITARIQDPVNPGKELFESHAVVTGPGTYEKIVINAEFSQAPIPWETVYIFGEAAEVTKLFRILSIALDEKRNVSIKAVETNDAIWSELGGVLIQPTAPTLPSAISHPQNVTNLYVEETYNRPGINISFDIPNDPIWYRADILISFDGSHFFLAAPGLQRPFFNYSPVTPGQTYTVKVISYSKLGIPSLNPPTQIITIVGNKSFVPEVRGLELFGQGNDTEWRNRDAKFAWRPIALRGGAGLNDADTDALNAGEGYPDEFWQSYQVEIWVGGNCVRREYTKDSYYIYTYEKNVEDNGVASNTVMIKVWNYSIFNQTSLNPAVLTVTNSVPALITGLTSKAVGGGVEFTWLPSSAKDHDYYEVRTSVATGGWSSWVKVQDCYYYRELTGSEILLYGNTAEIYIQARDIDTFGQTSSAVATNKLSGYVWGELLTGRISSPDGKTYFDLDYPEIHCEHPITGDYSKLSYGFLKFFKHGVATPYWYTRRLRSGIASDGTFITLNWDLTPKVSVAIHDIQTWKSGELGDQFVECYAEEVSSLGFRVQCRLKTNEGVSYTDDNVTIFSDGSLINNPNIEEPSNATTKKISIEQEVFTSSYFGIVRTSKVGTVTDRYKVNLTYKLYYKSHADPTWILAGTHTTPISIVAGWKWTKIIFQDLTPDRYDFKLEYVSMAQGVLVDTVNGSYAGWHGTIGQTGYSVYTGGTSLYQGAVTYLALEGG